jgi:hypothetical protein
MLPYYRSFEISHQRLVAPTMWFKPDGALGIAQMAQNDRQTILGQPVIGALSPFNQTDPIGINELLQANPTHLTGIFQAIQIDMVDRHTLVLEPGAIFIHNHETRAINEIIRPEPLRNTLDEVCLASPKLTKQKYQIASTQQLTKPLPDPSRLQRTVAYAI